MEYPTLQGKLLMPAYGRNVQRMVEHALTLEDREERNRCAKAIIRTMANLHPELNNANQQHTYYDHLALMSNFQLNIDYPYGEPQHEELTLTPAQLPYSKPTFPFRHYGKIIQAMVDEAVKEEDLERRHQLINLIANRLKYTYLIWNKDAVEATQIVHDIEQLSQGQLSCDFEEFRLLHGWQLVGKDDKNQQQSKKRKKK